MSDDIDHAAPFEAMAEKITANRENGFAGAFVVVPPVGEPIELLMLSGDQNPAIFWSQVKVRAEMAINELDQQQQQGWARR